MSIQIDWDQHGRLLIRDVHMKWHQRIYNFMLEQYFRPNRIYDKLLVQSEREVEDQYRKYVTHILNDECCVVALNDDNNEIHAVAMVKWMTRDWRSWTILRLAVQSAKLNELITFRRHVICSYAEAHPKKPFDSLHLFEYHISDKLKGDVAFMDKFFNAICEVARHMNMPRVTYLAMSQEEQNHMRDAGFTELQQFMYSMYVNKRGLRPFTLLRNIDEMYAALFEKQLVPLVPYYEMTVRWQEDPPPPQPGALPRL